MVIDTIGGGGGREGGAKGVQSFSYTACNNNKKRKRRGVGISTIDYRRFFWTQQDD